jgi:polyhydroxyalkanoate synthesis regulator phasin
MAGPGNGDPEPDALERLLALLDVRSLIDEAGSRLRGERVRVSEGTRQRVQDLARDLGLVTRDEWDELELRVAQLEHRVRLLEDTERP